VPGLPPRPPKPPQAKPPVPAGHPARWQHLGHARPTAALPGKTAQLSNPAAGRLDAHGTLIGTGKRAEPLKHHEVQQAGYQLAAKLNDTSIEDPGERRRLADATQTMHDTDHRLSGGYGAMATAVSEQLAGPNDNMLAGTALALGAGKCDAYVEINNRVHSQKLKPRETVWGMVNRGLGLGTAHTWSEIHRNPEPGTHKPAPIVMDAWASGPAARLQDTVWNAHSPTTQVVSRFGKVSGNSDFDQMQRIRSRHEPGGEHHAATMKDVRERRPASGKLLQDVQIIEPHFAAQAREKLQALSAFSQEVMAVAAAREAYALNVAQAARLASTAQIIDEAGRLDRQDRPPVVKPPGRRPYSPGSAIDFATARSRPGAGCHGEVDAFLDQVDPVRGVESSEGKLSSKGPAAASARAGASGSNPLEKRPAHPARRDGGGHAL
jgi:hypothetical protein